MDPRQKLQEKRERISSSRVPFIETYRETVYEEQILGGPLEREVFVVRIDKAYLKLYAFFLAFFLLLTIVIVFRA